MARWAWALVLVFALLPGTSNASTSPALQRIEHDIHALRRVLRVSESHRSRARASLRSSDRRLGQALFRLHTLKHRVMQAHRRQAALRSRMASLQGRLRSQLAMLAEESRAAYALQRRNYWTLLLDQDHPGRVRRILTYYRYVMREEAGDINEIRSSLRELGLVKQQLQGVARELETFVRAQSREEAVLRRERAQRARALAVIDRRVESQERRLARLHATRQRLRRLVKRLRAQRPPHPVPPGRLPSGRFSAARGELPSPVWISGAVRKMRPDGAGGVFFPVPSGTPIHAVFSGQVVYANWLRGFGLLLILEHDGGYMTIYAHVQSLYCRPGQEVAAGTVIATAGRSGGFRRPGLYFQIRRNGRPLSPLHWLRR
ncbi:MAG: murein hydrolase activator EnvC family protein [Acidiferrobacteraceae bacterium]